ncbi:MAG: hypothetical protein M1434_10065 [Chloroflexi bacterium]|nr:hypothetical protein [Chloroflexota bacterium]MCL5275070.1 hypothetical protein [Chloroflexota bacterium]
MSAILCTPDELVGALDALGVHFLSGGDSSPRARSLAPAELLAQLAAQPDARLRLAIIPLLLCRPEFASAAPTALEQLTEQRRQTFKLYYTAAAECVNDYATTLRMNLDLLCESAHTSLNTE